MSSSKSFDLLPKFQNFVLNRHFFLKDPVSTLYIRQTIGINVSAVEHEDIEISKKCGIFSFVISVTLIM